MHFLTGLIILIIGFAGGWYCCKKFGAKVAADVAAVQETAKKL